MKRLEPRRRFGPVAAASAFVIAIGAWWFYGTSGSPGAGDKTASGNAQAVAAKPSQLPCSKLLGCAAGRAIEDAAKQCQPQIEQLAVFAPRWTQRPGQSIFIDFMWLQAERGTITFLGKDVEFQDAAGNFGPVAYECDYDPVAKQVLNVRAKTAGR
jgi:hypothetical protein